MWLAQKSNMLWPCPTQHKNQCHTMGVGSVSGKSVTSNTNCTLSPGHLWTPYHCCSNVRSTSCRTWLHTAGDGSSHTTRNPSTTPSVIWGIATEHTVFSLQCGRCQALQPCFLVYACCQIPSNSSRKQPVKGWGATRRHLFKPRKATNVNPAANSRLNYKAKQEHSGILRSPTQGPNGCTNKIPTVAHHQKVINIL